VFGITGDLARKMTFRSLYRLERRGLLSCRVVGVAVSDWTAQQLRDHARQGLQEAGEEIDDRVFSRFADRLSYVSGDFDDDRTYERVAKELEDRRDAVFYLEIPPSLFATVVKGLAGAELRSDFAAVALEIDTWRWAGVPFLIRTGKCLLVTQTELRLLFKRPPRVHFASEQHRAPQPNQIVFKIDPTTGIRMIFAAQRADRPGAGQIEFDLEFAEEGGEGRRPTRCSCTPRWSATAPTSRGRTVSRRPGGSSSRCSMHRPRASVCQGLVGPGGGRPARGRVWRLARTVGPGVAKSLTA
jgi:glucose-6-phosphate 1-dehydrogenase